MLYTHDAKHPKIHPTSRIAPNAIVCGDVTIGANCSVGFGAVLTAESGPISIGTNCIIMDTAVIRGIRDNPVFVGNNVLVGPRAYLTGCEIADNVFLATGTTIFNGARVGARAEVRINAIVHLRTMLPQDAIVPICWVAVGDPVEILPPHEHERIWEIQRALDFPKYVFGVDRPEADQTFHPAVMPRYAKLLRHHSGDRPL
jgi:carbonic anhydrase/acetyltransferase-like protein (isoleucine patch superfamily)